MVYRLTCLRCYINFGGVYNHSININIRRCYDEEDLTVWMTKYNEFYTKIKAGEIEVPDYCSNDAMYARELAFDACKYLPSSRFVEASSTVEVLDRQNEVADIESYYDGSKEFIDLGLLISSQACKEFISHHFILTSKKLN